jgi:RNA polymerase sigma factor (sigma-70 family)
MAISKKHDPSLPPRSESDCDTDMELVLKRHLSWIQSCVHNKLGDFRRSKADTGDIVQESLIQFLRYGPRIKLSNDNQLRALLSRIIENVIRDRYAWFTARRRNIARERPLAPDTVLNLDPPQGKPKSPSQIVANQEEEAWTRLGMELLDPREREVIILHHWEDMSFMKIGKMLGMSKVGARKRYIRALTLLVETVEALQGGRLDSVLDAE